MHDDDDDDDYAKQHILRKLTREIDGNKKSCKSGWSTAYDNYVFSNSQTVMLPLISPRQAATSLHHRHRHRLLAATAAVDATWMR